MRTRFLSLALIVSLSITAFSANNSETEKRVTQLQGEVQRLNSELNSVKSNVATLTRQVSGVKVKQDSTQANLKATKQEVESVKSDFSQKTLALGDSIGSTNGKLVKTSKDMNSRSLLGLIGIVLALLSAAAIYYALKKKIKRGQSAIESIKEAQNKLNEESIKLDNQLVEIMNKQLDVHKETAKTAPSSSNANAIDHSLALKVADEIVRIELNLSRMDSSVKGYKQLSKAVERIKNNFLAQGYEIVDMLGKPYNDGMKAVASFVSDENLKEGEQIITGITKPQINYNGVMIQAAQITVSQNI